ncbi:carbohydrate esterase family 2 protein [Ceratobasidium sp. AG-Ba]|nr:carbohydrate esterase family 2 protein [Ceratobasidium sp. AG-Ba]QRW13032.1 carbohydrate esterase family 2 protein [Ceratobasidium sp. AG-Ba]
MGTNVIQIPPSTSKKDRVVHLQVEGFVNNRIHLENVELNSGAIVKPYKPSKLRFQFIGDSLSCGYFNPNGIDDAWTFLTAQNFKAEHNIQARPGACLTERPCYENPHGMSYLFFRTEDSNYYTSTDHNYTTPWDFRKDLTPTHVFLVIGANDDSNHVAADEFGKALTAFLARIRILYPTQHIFLFSPWGWPVWPETVPFRTYYDAIWPAAIANRTAAGDRRLHLVNTTGWVGYDGVISRQDGHPNPVGQLQVARHLFTWLTNWGLKPGHWES